MALPRSSFRVAVLLAIALGATTPLLLAPTDAAAATDAEDQDLKARRFFAGGDYRQALDIYVSLYAETLHPTYLRNIARCHQNLGNPDKAISSFREYLRKAHDLTPDQRAEIEGYIAEMEQLKRSNAGAGPVATAPPPPAPRPPDTSPALVGPPTITASGARDDDGGPFYTRVWFWGVVAGVAAAGVVGALLVTRDSGQTAGNLGGLDLRGKGP
jgi:tetratricopeptide (TPR) repeat protein